MFFFLGKLLHTMFFLDNILHTMLLKHLLEFNCFKKSSKGNLIRQLYYTKFLIIYVGKQPFHDILNQFLNIKKVYMKKKNLIIQRIQWGEVFSEDSLTLKLVK